MVQSRVDGMAAAIERQYEMGGDGEGAAARVGGAEGSGSLQVAGGDGGEVLVREARTGCAK